MDGEQEFAHDRADSLEFLEAAGVEKMAVEGPDIGVMASGAESGHIESDPQVAAWIEAGQGAPLLSAHVVGQDQPLAEELDGHWQRRYR